MPPATLRAPSGSDLVRDMSRGFSDAAASTPRRMSVTLATSSAATLSSTLRELASPLAPSTPTPRHSAPQAQPSSPAVPHHADATSSLGAAVPAASADVSVKEQFIQALSMCSDAVAVWEACIEMLLNKRVVHMLVSCFLNLSSLAAVPVCDPSNATFAPCTLPAPPPPTLRATPLPPFLRGTTPGSPMFAQDTITMADAVAVCISLTRSSRASSRARVVQQGAVALISASVSLQLHAAREWRRI
ncbi:MAG: hypothetical protein EOO41_05140 [Methanobacteriota archaeon]|nr:MAG: hypothetical protein EOO41_05140 [Euryarchaeota archaeon]